jgi:hypothetical protein
MLRLHPSFIDYAILAVYFVVVLGIGFVARLSIKTELDFFLSGRSLPAWITGALAKPVMPEPPETRGEGSGRIRRAPAT